MTKTLAAACMLAFVATASADPQLTSWLTKNSGQYARLYETTSAEAQGRVVTTWTNQSLPSYADIAEIASSANWVYIRYPDLASYNMGPWLTPGGGVFQFWPKNQHGLARFPRHPAQQTGTKTITGTGYSGNYVNGMAIFNALDGKAWDGGALVMGPHNKATYYWHRNAPVGESFNFDAGLGHQNPAGVYHTHQNPIALRFQLGDHVDFDSSNKAYSEDTNAPTRHSPIIGWSYDGYPIYGPYGYSSATDPDSGIRRMVSGYVQRDGTGGTDEVSTNRGVIPAWYARFRQAHFGGAYSTAAGTNRPAVNSTYPVGTFAEDFSYLGDVTNPATGEIYQQGTDFDLDVYNGRYCVTPEFPEGTYAYFVDIDDEGNSIYPYAFGFEFYGVASGSSGFASITEAVTTNFLGGADTPLALDAPSAQDSTVTLVWSSVDGGTYAVDSSTNGSDWSSVETSVASQGISTSTNYTSGGFRGTAYARVTRTALAEYDDAGGGSGTVNQSAVRSYQVANDSIAISINFTGTNDSSISSPMSSAEVAGVYQAANWNNSTNAASGDLNNVMDSLGTATSASISWAFDGVGVTAAANTAGDYRMMKGYLDVTNGSTGTITVSGLPSTISSGYDVLVYFDGANGSAGRVAQFKIGTAALFGKDNTIYYGVFVRSTNLTDNASATPYGNYVLFTNLSGSSFTLTATPGYASDGNPHAEVNGIQIISAAAGVTAVTTNPVSQVACQGSTAVFRAAAQSAATLSVQWKVKANGDDTFVDIPDATDTVLEVTAAASDDGNQYEAVFSSDLGDAATTPATLAVAPVPDATITSADASVFGGSTGNSASGPGGLASYGW
ncbi:MAG TPA: YHYH protein, partial [Verrucomicrobiae bacterium]|nr:YHYH protein [Verrucomicrobiae bacterium]